MRLWKVVIPPGTDIDTSSQSRRVGDVPINSSCRAHDAYIGTRADIDAHRADPPAAGDNAMIHASRPLIAALVVGAGFIAQTPQQFRGRVDVVRIDVAVSERNRPMRGLPKSAFVL